MLLGLEINRFSKNQKIYTMKKSILFTLSILFCISLNSQRGANAEYWVSFTYLPKKGMVEEFEKAVADKTAKYNATEEDAIFAFQIMTGGGQGAYQRWVVRKDRSFFDQDNAKELKYWNENVDPYIADKSVKKFGKCLRVQAMGGMKQEHLLNIMFKIRL